MNKSTYYLPKRGTTRIKKCDIPLHKLYLDHLTHLRENTLKGNQCFWKHLTTFASEDITIKQITPKFCQNFADYLITQVRINSARTYLQKLHAILQDAVMRGYIPYNPVPPLHELLPRFHVPERAYLTVNEIKRLNDTECMHESTKLAFLFACHTGLRLSDIETLKWEHFQYQNRVVMIVKFQVKTNQEVRIPLGNEALKIIHALKTKTTSSEYVFHLHSRTTIYADLNDWCKRAKIHKHVTFHVARHSFATLSISAGVSLYAVSKLCGHTNIQTTQIYARIIDSTRIKAIESLDALFSSPKRKRNEKNNKYDLIL